MKSGKSGKERRRKNRWQVAVLVRCSMPKHSNEMYDLEMWAKDVNEDGLRLELTRGLNIVQVDERGPSNNHALRFDDIEFKKGSTIKIQDLFYDDEGSPFINGKVTWARRLPTGGWGLGIRFNEKSRQSKNMMAAFKDFLKIVKNPVSAIEKASRKN